MVIRVFTHTVLDRMEMMNTVTASSSRGVTVAMTVATVTPLLPPLTSSETEKHLQLGLNLKLR